MGAKLSLEYAEPEWAQGKLAVRKRNVSFSENSTEGSRGDHPRLCCQTAEALAVTTFSSFFLHYRKTGLDKSLKLALTFKTLT